MESGAQKTPFNTVLLRRPLEPGLERSIRYSLERQRSEEALRDSEARHRGMFDHFPIGLYRTSTEGDLIYANTTLVDILGDPDSETLQTVYADDLFVDPVDRQRFSDMLDQFGVARGFETQLRRTDGTLVLVRNTARAHRAEDNRILYVEGAVEDITDAD